MKLKNPMLVVSDMEKSVEFYKKGVRTSCYHGFRGKQDFNGRTGFTDT